VGLPTLGLALLITPAAIFSSLIIVGSVSALPGVLAATAKGLILFVGMQVGVANFMFASKMNEDTKEIGLDMGKYQEQLSILRGEMQCALSEVIGFYAEHVEAQAQGLEPGPAAPAPVR